jgi:hypothetical protein
MASAIYQALYSQWAATKVKKQNESLEGSQAFDEDSLRRKQKYQRGQGVGLAEELR